MANEIIKCRSNKTVLVDPNAFDGQSSVSNISVPLEDLTISVELGTERKARTLLTTQKSGDNLSSSIDKVSVKFIEGSEINGKKYLTTKFTDLTTVFDGSNDGENLGITSIDIQFDASYTPLITINFIDVRGSAIFQNEDNAINNINKYSVFFQVPYPLYQLTIKGYFGQPVKYCLHMTKFSSKFNSQTGNFEITTSFIGYTFAILSDMLLGHLKAIQYTSLGKTRYDELKSTDPKLLTLDELYVAVSNINGNTRKLLATDEDSSQLSNGDNKKNQLSDVETNLLILGQQIDFKDILTKYEFIIVDPTKESENKLKIEKYTTNITQNIETYNTDTNFKLELTNFTNISKKLYKGLTVDLLDSSLDFGPNLIARKKQLQTIFGAVSNSSPTDIDDTRSRLYEHVTNNTYSLGPRQVFDVYDNRDKYLEIEVTRNNINLELEKLKKSLAEKLRASVKESLGFDPTIRNLINIYTTAVEVYLYVLFNVSKSAADPTNLRRTKQLEKFKDIDSYDIKANSVYYPWPEYRANDGQLVETYLGKPGVLQNPRDVDELRFIDEFLLAFLTQNAQAKNNETALEENQKNWYPINILDSRIFNDNFPYTRIPSNTRGEVLLLVMLRAMTALGHSNKSLSPEEIDLIATAEAQSMLTDIKNDVILQSLTQVTVDDFLDAEGEINGKTTKVVKKLSNDYYYDYIFDASAVNQDNAKLQKIIPVNSDFTGNWSANYLDLVEKAKSKKLFLTNYTTTDKTDSNNSLIKKPDDGGTYIKIVSKEEYVVNAHPLISEQTNTETILDLSKLKLAKDKFPKFGEGVGFNILGGLHGTQEFTKLNYGSDDLKDLPFMYVFYHDGNYGDKVYNKSNGLGLKRKISGEDGSTPTKSDFDITIEQPSAYRVATNINQLMSYIDYDESTGIDWGLTTNYRLHKNYGKNRVLSNEYLKGNQDITYPYINFQVYYRAASDNNQLAPVSLFGSRLYYEQKTEYAKALLFLHTFPWNGLISDSNGETNKTIFDKPEILNTFSQRAGFISAPKLWVAFIGGMLWRADYTQPVYGDLPGRQESGGSGLQDPILFKNTTESFIPTFGTNLDPDNYPSKWKYLTLRQNITDFPNNPMAFRSSGIIGDDYKELDSILLSLPQQAQDEFKKVFFDFVGSSEEGDFSEWAIIKSKLEIFKQTTDDWKTTYENTINTNSALFESDDKMYLNTTIMRTTYNVKDDDKYNFDNYNVFSPVVDDDDFKHNFILELKDDSQAVKTILDSFTKEIIIGNTTYKIWKENESTNKTDIRESISVTKDDLKKYLDRIVNIITTNKELLSLENKRKEQEMAIFGTADENLIKLQLYKTCKNIYDKWIGGSDDAENVIFQCGSRNSIDSQLASKRGYSNPKLIDSFRFVTRSFRDVGDELVINPIPVNDFLRDNPNSSFYDAISTLLVSNNFHFIPLPAFINYNDEETLKSMFKPLSYYETQKLNAGVSGPAFVCVYVGQPSKHLDFNGSDYENDGFDVRCKDGSMLPNLAKDFSENTKDGENNVAFFEVNFGQQNQNIFKDVTLDQSEYAETAESIQIQDDISKKGDGNNRTIAGQNIYNVYALRTHSVQIEMLGNIMIQPMMHFQLNNIPMYHGAYLITKVTHNIKPNYMSTTFTGTRLRKAETEIMKVADLYMSLLDTIDTTDIQVAPPTGVFGGNTPSSGAKNPLNPAKAVYAPFITYDVVETDSLKYQYRIKGIAAKGDTYTMPECGEFILQLAKKWHAANITAKGTDTLYVNNFGAHFGGTNVTHGGDGGRHALGLAVDLQPMAITKKQQGCIVGNPNYDRAKNIEFIQMAIDLHKSQDKIKIQNIILNDSVIINKFKNEKGSQGPIVIFYKGHENHIHIEWDFPPRVLNDIKNNVIQQSPIVSSGVKGQVTKFTGKLPNESEKLSALGQI